MPADSWSTIATLAVLALTVVFFALGKLRSDLVAVCALLALILCGVLTPQEALAGFSNSIIPTLAGVFIVGGAIVRSGLASAISDKMLKLAGTNQNALFMLLMLITAGIGSMVSNTGTVAIMMPIVVSVSLALNVSPSRFLMPLAFMSGIGGMLTLIGNPGNMVVNDVYVKAGFPSLTLFSFLPVGIVSLAFGMIVLAPATSYYLARRKNEKGEQRDKGLSLRELADKYQLAQNVSVFVVPEHSPMVGHRLMDLGLTGRFGVSLLEIRRRKAAARRFQSRLEKIVPDGRTEIQSGDLLYGRGAPDNLDRMAEEFRLRRADGYDLGREKETDSFDSIGLCELVLMSSSRLVDRTVADAGLREQFGVNLLGIQRGDQYILDDFQHQILHAGDSLLVQGSWEKIARLDESSRQWVVVGRPQEQMAGGGRDKIPFVCAVIAGMIVSMAAGLLPTVVAVMLAAVLLIVGRCYRNVEDAYSAISWETVVMIACMLPMATAMEKTGLLATASAVMTDIGVDYGPHAALGVVYGLTSALNIVISATPVALFVAPAAIQIALDLGCSPLPFVYGVATASCMCFASPFSAPFNALVMSAGRYTFADYLKIGLPLQALMGVYMVMLLPLLFPF